MKKILITGATGNVGLEVIKALQKLDHPFEIYAGTRNIEKDKEGLGIYNVNLSFFDFADVESFKPAFENCDILFLLRPPQISNVKKYFKPLLEVAVQSGIQHIVFLSVQGVENSKIIPHHKIEKLIVESKIPFTFLRPAYFMQNFSTTLHDELVKNQRIFLPAGNAKFTLIDVTDIGEVAAKILTETKKHLNQSYELTCDEKLTFAEMAIKLSTGLNTEIKYISPGLLHFYITKRKEKMPSMFILVMIMLHYFPRFQKEPAVSDCVQSIIHKPPKTFEQFIIENKNRLC